MKKLALVIGLIVLMGISGIALAENKDKSPRISPFEIGINYGGALMPGFKDSPKLRLALDIIFELTDASGPQNLALKFPIFNIGKDYFSFGFAFGGYACSGKFKYYLLSYEIVKDKRIQDWATKNNKALVKNGGSVLKGGLEIMLRDRISLAFEVGSFGFGIKEKTPNRIIYSSNHSFYTALILAFRF